MSIPLDKSLLVLMERAGYATPQEMRQEMEDLCGRWQRLFNEPPGSDDAQEASLAAVLARSRVLYGAQRLKDSNLIKAYSYVLSRPTVPRPATGTPAPPPAPPIV